MGWAETVDANALVLETIGNSRWLVGSVNFCVIEQNLPV